MVDPLKSVIEVQGYQMRVKRQRSPSSSPSHSPSPERKKPKIELANTSAQQPPIIASPQIQNPSLLNSPQPQTPLQANSNVNGSETAVKVVISAVRTSLFLCMTFHLHCRRMLAL